MQNDLISRSALMEEIEKSLKENPHSDTKVAGVHCHEHRHFMTMVAAQPTAYDVEKVVAELNDYYEERLVIVTPQARERVEEIIRNGGNE